MKIDKFLFSIILSFCISSSCSSCSEEQEPPPNEIYSGFDFKNDAFTFSNFGDGTAMLHGDLVGRMFGPETVCMNKALPCELDLLSEAWMETANVTLKGGHSEGFAVLSQLFHSGELQPEDFGAETVAELTLVGNPKLQDELAYWSATQSIPSALENDKKFSADEVIPFLAKALHPNSKEVYRLAIVRRT